VSNDYFELLNNLLKGGALFELGDSIDHQGLVLDLCQKLRYDGDWLCEYVCECACMCIGLHMCVGMIYIYTYTYTHISLHPIVETQWSKADDQVDELLCGVLALLKELITQLPEQKRAVGMPSADGKSPGLIFVLYDCLFGKPTPQTQATMLVPPPKCKTHKARGMAFELLAELGKGCIENTQELVELFSPNHLRKPNSEDGARRMEWNFESKAEGKSDVGYVGLRNLGCTCYMNSVLQQLYMIPQFRRNLLATDKYDSEEDLKESVVYQVQSIFGNLQESEKQYTDARGLCHAFKDWEGLSVNVSVQEDAGEFLRRLVDKIETPLKGTAHEKAVECVTGMWAHEMIGQGDCTHFRDREEPFVNVLLKIQNKKTIQEALQAWCHGELLSGNNAVNCDHCSKKVETLRRTCFKKLPPVVCLVLSRFEMNYYTMQTTKINDRVEFPTELNFKPYTQEGMCPYVCVRARACFYECACGCM
jgi:ubiquitin C-terminal hydrolase